MNSSPESAKLEYVANHGTYADIPFDAIVAAWESAYGRERMQGWIQQMEATENRRDIDTEAVVKP